jgi:hypothetical protein
VLDGGQQVHQLLPLAPGEKLLLLLGGRTITAATATALGRFDLAPDHFEDFGDPGQIVPTGQIAVDLVVNVNAQLLHSRLQLLHLLCSVSGSRLLAPCMLCHDGFAELVKCFLI